MKLDEKKFEEYLKSMPPDTKIYFGADSERVNIKGVWYVDYLMAIVVHEGARNGAKIFGEITRERDYDKNLSKPRNRLMTEVYKVSELYLRLKDIIDPFEVSVHLDINPNEKHGSSVVVKEAIGYIRGTCMLEPVVKPHSFAGSNVADQLHRLLADAKKNEYVKEES